ncbi:ABC transporter permease [Haloactinopolyspora alba]|uniref:ABC transporter permease n=1 Tax=Haloactinopolyspora alba TaxID=648780 RepID=UPI00197AEAA8|nr:ABC transporter permease [Haloactinopolyspora alba]
MTAAEWLKIRSVRSTVWALPVLFVLGVGLAYAVGYSFRDGFADMPREQRETFDPLFATFYGLTIAQLAAVVVGALAAGQEFSTSTIRTSFAATPRRVVFYGAKTLAVAGAVLAVSLVTVPVAFVTAQAALGPHGTSLSAADARAAVVGACLYLPLISVFALGVATALGSAARALGVLLPVLFLGSQGLGNMPQIRDVVQYLPDQAGMVLMHLDVDGDPQFGRDYGSWAASAILVAWTAFALVGGYLALRRRDV